MSELELDEVRVIVLPAPQTAAVNRLLREERGWRLLEVEVADGGSGAAQVVYVLGHAAEEA